MRDYFQVTRGAWHSFLFALPLLVLYQLTVVLANAGSARAVVNGADALLQNVLSLVGVHGWLAAALFVAGVGGVAAYRADQAARGRPTRWGYLPWVLLESSLYALLFGSLVSMLTAMVLPGGGLLQVGGGLTFGQKLASGLGAGLYEELVFRLVLMGGMVLGLRKLGVPEGTAVLVGLLVSSLLFSGVHYLPPYGDPLELGSFTFRFLAGMVLAGLFAVRGFAVAAWTHSLYDVLLLFARGV